MVVLLQACANSPIQPEVVDKGANAPIQRESSQQPNAANQVDTEPSQTPAKPTSGAATASLLAEADKAEAANQPNSAVAYVERAIRIDPRNSDLWIKLSNLFLNQGNTNVANQHARKAIALANHSNTKSRAAWLQMARVKEAQGEKTEARAIRRRWSSVRG